MPYVKSNRGTMPGARQALGGISDVASALRDVAVDPCLFQVAKSTSHLVDVLRKPSSGPPSPPTPGIGLCHAVQPLYIATYIAEKPWVVPLGITMIVGTLVGLGYMIGRGR